MMRRFFILAAAFVFIIVSFVVAIAEDMEILGIKFPGEKVVEGKTLKLNGVAYRKALGFVKVYVTGLYLEKPTKDADEVINSEQVKHLVTRYMTDRATASTLQNGVWDAMKKCNPPELVEANRVDIEKYISWMDRDMAPGLKSESTYIPGKGFKYSYQGVEKGMIPGSEFMKMYYRMSVGKKAQKEIRKGLLGL
jgi:hypothetical protein